MKTKKKETVTVLRKGTDKAEIQELIRSWQKARQDWDLTLTNIVARWRNIEYLSEKWTVQVINDFLDR